MALEDLMRAVLVADESVRNMVASYDGKPAVFERVAPNDAASGWPEGGPQYPRVNYAVSRREVPDRRIQGTLSFQSWCRTDDSSDVRTEDLDALLREILDGTVFHPEGEPVTALRWNKSGVYRESARTERSGDQLQGGLTEFDLISFPATETFEPDPVTSLNDWSRVKWGSRLQVDPETWGPTQDTPALYWRLDGGQKAQRDPDGWWTWAQVMAHIIAPDTQTRLYWAREVFSRLMEDGTLDMSDGAILYLGEPTWSGSRDPYRDGQISLMCRFKTLYATESVPFITDPHIDLATT